MGKLAPNHIAYRACREVSRLFNSSSRLCDNASLELIPTSFHSGHRNIQTPKATTADRQRSALEALIANVAPKDAAAMSDALLGEFNSLGRVLSETQEAIERVIGPKSEISGLLYSAHQACMTSLSTSIRLKIFKVTDQRLIDYLIASMGSQPTECLRVLYLDRAMRLIGDEVSASGSLSSLTVFPRVIFKRALEISASGIVLVHNHPSGTVEPSQCDVEFTRSFAASARLLEIELFDHIIVTESRWFSFAKRGLI